MIAMDIIIIMEMIDVTTVDRMVRVRNLNDVK